MLLKLKSILFSYQNYFELFLVLKYDIPQNAPSNTLKLQELAH